MAKYEMHDRVIRQRVYTLALPSNAVEIEKMLSAARDDAKAVWEQDVSDDTIRVEADEDAFYLIYDVSTEDVDEDEEDDDEGQETGAAADSGQGQEQKPV